MAPLVYLKVESQVRNDGAKRGQRVGPEARVNRIAWHDSGMVITRKRECYLWEGARRNGFESVYAIVLGKEARWSGDVLGSRAAQPLW